jgi:hypothetical protein
VALKATASDVKNLSERLHHGMRQRCAQKNQQLRLEGERAEKQYLPQTSIVLQDVVNAQSIEPPCCCVWSEIRRERKFEQQLSDVVTNVQTRAKSMLDDGKREVSTFVGEEAVVCQCVEHGTRASCCRWLVW